MSEQLHEWCLELLTKATGVQPPAGHTAKEEKYKYHGFASHGYRNTDVVNSMIAFFYEYDAIETDSAPWWGSNKNKQAVREYMKWVEAHVSEDDWDDVREKAQAVIPYILRYRNDPSLYLIQCDYLPLDKIVSFM